MAAGFLLRMLTERRLAMPQHQQSVCLPDSSGARSAPPPPSEALLSTGRATTESGLGRPPRANASHTVTAGRKRPGGSQRPRRAGGVIARWRCYTTLKSGAAHGLSVLTRWGRQNEVRFVFMLLYQRSAQIVDFFKFIGNLIYWDLQIVDFLQIYLPLSQHHCCISAKGLDAISLGETLN